MQKLSKSLATLWFTGYCPVAPGTAASLLGVGVYLLVRHNTILHSCVTATALAAGFISSHYAERAFAKRDPGQIVIDEFSSMLLAYLFLPYSKAMVVSGFVLFRIFDVIKIPPLGRLENLPGGYGIMLDDIMAAVLTNLILHAALAAGLIY